MSETPESVFLFFTEGSADKVYNVHLRQRNDGWVVDFENGRRGKALRQGTKTDAPLSFEAAKTIFEKTVGAKVKKGYTPDETGAAFRGTENAGRVTPYKAQLANPAPDDLSELGPLSDYLVQAKHDGEHRGIILKDGKATFANRRGLEVGVHEDIAYAAERLAVAAEGDCILAAEDMGDHIVVFDVVEYPSLGADDPFERRADILHGLAIWSKNNAFLSETFFVDVPVEAETFFAEGRDAVMREAGAEGYILRHRGGCHTPGRPAQGGSLLKRKFVEDCTVRVAEGRSGRRSVGMELRNGAGDWMPVGNVTIPASQDMPAPGSLIDVRYLYAYRDGALYQPVYRGPRTDVLEEECRIDRLKFNEPAARPGTTGDAEAGRTAEVSGDDISASP